MRPVRIVTAVIFAATLAVTGCAAHSTAVDSAGAPTAEAAGPKSADAPTSPVSHRRTQPAPTPSSGVHFATPEAAMRYLAGAYNRNDLAALMHVTTPPARHNLLAMRADASDLRLVGCNANPGRGDYLCGFTHGYPAAAHQASRGQAHFTVAPADRPGWYMTVLNDCG